MVFTPNVPYIEKRKKGVRAPVKGYWQRAYEKTLETLDISIEEAEGRYIRMEMINEGESLPEDLREHEGTFTTEEKERIKKYRQENGYVRRDGSIIEPDGSSHNWKIVSGLYRGEKRNVRNEVVEIYLKVGNRSKVPGVFQVGEGRYEDSYRCMGTDAVEVLKGLRNAVAESSKDDGGIGQKLYEQGKNTVYKPKVKSDLNFDDLYEWNEEADRYIKK